MLSRRRWKVLREGAVEGLVGVHGQEAAVQYATGINAKLYSSNSINRRRDAKVVRRKRRKNQKRK